MSEPSQRRRWPVGAMWALLFLVIIEIVMRSVWSPWVVGESTYKRMDPTFGFGFAHARAYCEPHNGKMLCPKVQYTHYPRQSFPLEKSPTTFRFFTLGGSHALGKSSYTPKLVTRLQQRCPGLTVQGINLAVGGYGSERLRQSFARLADLDKDVVLFDYGGTNEYEDGRERAYFDQMHEGIWSLLLQSYTIVVGRKLYSSAFTVDLVTVQRTNEELAHLRTDEIRRAWRERTLENYQALSKEMGSSGAEVVVVGRTLSPRHPDLALLTELVGDSTWMANGDNVRAFDAQSAFNAAEAEHRLPKLYKKDHSHFTDRGHEVMATGLESIFLDTMTPVQRAQCQ